ncbi:MAG: ABC transporter permease, partial [Candidatus Zixiibacteriota bacterium]
MKIPFYYSYRNLFARRLTTGLTVLGIGLVVFVFCAVLMMGNGIKQTLVTSGYDDNAILIRKASQNEMNSYIVRDQAGILESQMEIARGADGKPLVAGELYVVVSLEKRDGGGSVNVVVRGVKPVSLAIRPNIKLTAGRMFSEGLSEVIVGKQTAARYKGAELGGTLKFGRREWRVVGVFEAGRSAFESEVWGDVNQMMAAFDRSVVSSMTMKLADPSKFSELKKRLEGDPRLTVDVKREKEYYADQSYATSSFINILGMVISIIFSFGAVIGAMITMYASVANRSAEIGTLRALGFQRRSILGAFLAESVLLSFIGGVIGVAGASLLSFVTVSTTNWDTFSELAFGFALSTAIIGSALVFSVLMGFFGGFLPAVR